MVLYSCFIITPDALCLVLACTCWRWRWSWRVRGLSAVSSSSEDNRPHHWGSDQHDGKHKGRTEHHQWLPVVERLPQLPPPITRKIRTLPTTCERLLTNVHERLWSVNECGHDSDFSYMFDQGLVPLFRVRSQICTALDRPIRTQSWRGKAVARSTRSCLTTHMSTQLVCLLHTSFINFCWYFGYKKADVPSCVGALQVLTQKCVKNAAKMCKNLLFLLVQFLLMGKIY